MRAITGMLQKRLSTSHTCEVQMSPSFARASILRHSCIPAFRSLPNRSFSSVDAVSSGPLIAFQTSDSQSHLRTGSTGTKPAVALPLPELIELKGDGTRGVYYVKADDPSPTLYSIKLGQTDINPGMLIEAKYRILTPKDVNVAIGWVQGIRHRKVFHRQNASPLVVTEYYTPKSGVFCLDNTAELQEDFRVGEGEHEAYFTDAPEAYIDLAEMESLNVMRIEAHFDFETFLYCRFPQSQDPRKRFPLGRLEWSFYGEVEMQPDGTAKLIEDKCRNPGLINGRKVNYLPDYECTFINFQVPVEYDPPDLGP